MAEPTAERPKTDQPSDELDGGVGGLVRRVRRHKVVAAALAVIPLVAGTTTVIKNYDTVLVKVGLRDDPAAQVTRAEAVRECMSTHQMKKAQDPIWRTAPIQEGETSDQTRVFRVCAWPPAPGADPDGYSEISVRFAQGPNTESQWPIGPKAYRLRSDNCATFEMLVSASGGSGHVTPQPAIRVDRNEIRTVEGDVWEDDPRYTKLPFLRQRDEAIVLSNDHFILDGVTCSSGVET